MKTQNCFLIVHDTHTFNGNYLFKEKLDKGSLRGLVIQYEVQGKITLLPFPLLTLKYILKNNQILFLCRS